MPKYKYSLVACARWEQEDIVEWVQYHQSIGFDHFYIYSNDDNPITLYKRLAPFIHCKNPIVTYFYWPKLGEQLPMYLHFLANHKDETAWAAFIDIDEFLVFKHSNNVRVFMSEFEFSHD